MVVDGPGVSPIAIARFFGAPRGFCEPYFKAYGDSFGMYVPGMGQTVFIRQPEHLKALFLNDQTHCGAGDQDMLGPVLGQSSLLVSEGELHKRHRQMLTPPFHGERMRTYGTLMRQVTRDAVSSWTSGEELSLQEHTSSITLSVIIRAVFGITDGERFDRMHAAINEMLRHAGPLTLFVKSLRFELGGLTPWGKLKRALEEVDHLLYAQIAARRDEDLTSSEDILALMMLARDDTGAPLDDGEIRDELLTLLLAGHETTATALAWAVYWLESFPDVKAKLKDELAALPDDAAPEEIAKQPYLLATCNEILRIEPIIPETARILLQPLEIAGHALPEGVYVLPSIWATHHLEDLYPEPDEFRPERFLERSFSPFEHVPFGGGVRKCIGYAFALYELKMVLFELLRADRLTLVDADAVHPVRRNFSVGPSDGLRVRVV